MTHERSCIDFKARRHACHARVEGDLAAVCSPHSGERIGWRHGWGGLFAVRPPDELALGHLPGAVNIPLRELEERLAELDPAQEIVPYCRGAYYVLACEAVAALRAKGFKARRLEDGLPEWRAAGLPILSGSIERKI